MVVASLFYYRNTNFKSLYSVILRNTFL